MTSFESCCGLRQLQGTPNRREARVLEALLDRGIPEPAPNIGKGFVVVVLKSSADEWWIGIEDVLHSERERRAIQPGAPSTRTVLCGGDGHDIFLLAIVHLHVFPAILGQARYVSYRRRREVERVGPNEVERSPLPYFARPPYRA